MGKKSKQKQIRRQQGGGVKPSSRPAATLAESTTLGQRLVQGATETGDRPTVRPNDALSDHSHLRGDLRRIAVLLAVIVVVLVSAVIVRDRSNYLTRAGAGITRFMQL